MVRAGPAGDPAPLFLHEEAVGDIINRSALPRFRKLRCGAGNAGSSSSTADCLRSWQAAIREAYPATLRGGALWGRCNVVGGSGSVLRSKRGHLIDDADAVWRVNDAPVEGFEAWVGSRTTFRVWGGVPMPWRRTPAWSQGRLHGQALRDGANETLLLFCQPTKWLGQCYNTIPAQPHPRLSPLLWPRVREHIRSTTQSVSIGRFPTTGAMALWAAMRSCDRVQIFGFGDGTWDCASPAGGPTRGTRLQGCSK